MVFGERSLVGGDGVESEEIDLLTESEFPISEGKQAEFGSRML